MATRLFPPFYQFEDADGIPLVGGTLEFYAAGTSATKDTFADAGLTIPNGTITLNALGRAPVPIFASIGDYRVILKDADGVVIGDEDPVAGANADVAGSGSSFRNLLINGDFALNQRVVTSAADDAYAHDGWYALTNTGSVTVATQTLAENGTPTSARLTQPDVTAKRLGYAQIIESANCRYTRGGSVTLSGRVRHSIAAPIRYAILSWTSTADAVTSDVVLDWLSPSFTAGGFFLAAGVTVQAVGAVTPAAATWTALPPISATISGSMNNLIAFVWTENTTAQNATLDLARLQLEPGNSASVFEYLPRETQLSRCRRYYQKSFSLTTAPAQATEPATAISITQAVAASTAQRGNQIDLAVPMRVFGYTVTLFNPASANAEARNNTVGADCSSTSSAITGDGKFTVTTITPGGSAAGNTLAIHYTAEAAL